MNLHLTDRLFSQESHFVSFIIFQSNLCFGNAEERPKLWKADRFATMRQIWDLFNSNLNKYVVPVEYLSIDKTQYPMRHQMAFRQYNPRKCIITEFSGNH